MDSLLDQLLNTYVPQATIDTMKAFNASHVSYVLSQIPLTLTAESSLPVTSGYPRSTSATATLSGTANAIKTRSVLVNGSPATYVAWQGTWSANNVPLTPGLNRILIQSLDQGGVEFGRTNIDIWYDTGAVVNNVSSSRSPSKRVRYAAYRFHWATLSCMYCRQRGSPRATATASKMPPTP